MGKWLSPAPPEDIDEAIEKLANLIVRKYDMGTPAIMALESGKPLAPMLKTYAWFAVTPYVPLLETVLPNADVSVMKYMDLLESDKNLERLVKRIEQLQRQVDKERILGKRK
ncbi:MAG: hypothetical protein ACXACH_05140, partial [Candidatus Hermodarchaeia archaeon]